MIAVLGSVLPVRSRHAQPPSQTVDHDFSLSAKAGTVQRPRPRPRSHQDQRLNINNQHGWVHIQPPKPSPHSTAVDTRAAEPFEQTGSTPVTVMIDPLARALPGDPHLRCHMRASPLPHARSDESNNAAQDDGGLQPAAGHYGGASVGYLCAADVLVALPPRCRRKTRPLESGLVSRHQSHDAQQVAAASTHGKGGLP